MLRRIILASLLVFAGGCHTITGNLPGGGRLNATDLMNKVSFKSAHYENKKTGEVLDIQGWGSDQTEVAQAMLNLAAQSAAAVAPALLAARGHSTPLTPSEPILALPAKPTPLMRWPQLKAGQ